jgi:HD superfamily phosphohydrolase
LGDVICSPGIDLDNIDNVIRAATAMGIREYGPAVAENLARNFIFDGGRVCIDEIALPYLEAWKRARSSLYGMIYASIKDFSLQTMLKHALHKLAEAPVEDRLLETDWNMTDDELIHGRLLKNSATHDIVSRMRLGEVYNCLAFLLVESKDLQDSSRLNLVDIEQAASAVYKKYINMKLAPAKEFQTQEIIANAYLDNRIRSPGRPTSFMGTQRYLDAGAQPLRWLLGIFTPYHRKWDRESEKAFIHRLPTKYTIRSLRLVREGDGRYPNVEEVQD